MRNKHRIAKLADHLESSGDRLTNFFQLNDYLGIELIELIELKQADNQVEYLRALAAKKPPGRLIRFNRLLIALRAINQPMCLLFYIVFKTLTAFNLH